MLGFPVGMLVRFWLNHHLLDLTQRPCWRVVKGRSRSYVDKVGGAAPPPVPPPAFLSLPQLPASFPAPPARTPCRLDVAQPLPLASPPPPPFDPQQTLAGFWQSRPPNTRATP